VVRELLLLFGLFVIAYQDWRKQEVFVYVTAAVALLGVIFRLCEDTGCAADMLSGASIGAVLLLLSYVTRQRIGYGDGVVFLMTGIFLGFWQNAELLLLSLWLAGLVALFLLFVRKWRREDCIPFVPFVFGAYVLLLI
jgi:leader peptidase (prepilin peptidase)/N-methyltransferase